MSGCENAFMLRGAGSGAPQFYGKETMPGGAEVTAGQQTSGGSAAAPEAMMPGGISADWLKVIAMVTMVIDHVGAALFPQFVVLRLIGRIAFPIYIWLLVMGFTHTRNRRKYMLRMAGCALLSEIPFDLAFSGEMTFRWQNVYFSLFWGLVLMTVLEKLLQAEAHRLQTLPMQQDQAKSARRPRGAWAVGILLTLVLFMLPAELLHFDYGFTGPVLVTVFYLYCRTGRPNLTVGFWLFSFSNLLSPLFAVWEMGGMGLQLLSHAAVWEGALATALIECFGILALPFIRRCSGIRRWKRGKTFFYLFYPLHLLILYVIRRLLIG